MYHMAFSRSPVASLKVTRGPCHVSNLLLKVCCALEPRPLRSPSPAPREACERHGERGRVGRVGRVEALATLVVFLVLFVGIATRFESRCRGR